MKLQLNLAVAAAILLATACVNTKYADTFGFLPENTPEANSEAFQRCLDGGGRIRVRKPGEYKLCRTIFLDSNTDLKFAPGAILSRAEDSLGVAARFVLLNRGAITREYNENICIKGLQLQANGIDAGKGRPVDIPTIVGMCCHTGFFYVRNLVLDGYTFLDLPPNDFAIQICTFENAVVENVHIEGMKDAVHFGPGRNFVVQHGVFRTYDDPIALNAHDYTTSNPELGWIENGVIEDCTDLDDPERGTTGFFARILAGGWRDWEPGMDIQSSGDAVVCGGRIYRSNGPKVKVNYVSTCRPEHTEGTLTYPDGITWTMSQDRNICHSCGVRNVVFRDIRLEKKRKVALCLHFDHDQFSRSFYPYAEIPVQSNIVFERVQVLNEIPALIQSRTPVDSIILRDSRIGSSEIRMLHALDTEGMVYDTTVVRMVGVEADDLSRVVGTAGRPVKVIVGCSNPGSSSTRAIDPVDFARVDIDDSFWSPRLERHREVTIPVCIAQIKDSTFRLQNFVEAARKLALAGSQQADPPQHRGYFFDDSDVYKALEGFAYSLQLHPDSELEALCDDWIAKFAAAQEPDGYINTYFTLKRPEDKWTDMDKHEMYCAGHLTEAAVAYYRATGKKSLLEVAEKMIAHIMSVFGPNGRHWVPGHEEVELALVKLYDVTGKEEYLDFAHWLLEQRGRGYGVWKNTKLKADHYQDLVPVGELTDVGGHAVRAMYLYSGMADVQALRPEAGYDAALDRLWEDVVLRNMYITGGIGSTRVGEAFTRDYDLPNAEAYCETCASIGMVFWNWRMNLMRGDAKYADVVERALYNGVLAGINLAGDRFFYVNPLESDGNHHRKAWYGCACCPSNLCRFLPSLGGYVYGEAPGAIYVNLYIGSTLSRKAGFLSRSERPLLKQTGRYPWDGDICLEFLRPCRDELHLRLPGWCKSYSLCVNGKPSEVHVESGYAVLPGPWKKGDRVELVLDMPVERVSADPRVLADKGKRAVCRGPLVYCLEDANGPLDGIEFIEHGGLQWIPYFAWDNRAPGRMKVWVDLQ